MHGDRAQDAVKVLEGPLTVESGLLAHLVKRPDSAVAVDGMPADAEWLAHLGVTT